MELEKFWKTIPERESLDDLDMEQSQGLFRLLLLSVFADDKVTTPERMTLAQAVTRFPFFRAQDWHRFEGTDGIRILADFHERSHRDDEPETLLGEISAALGDEPRRVLGLRLVARLMLSDGYAGDEHAFCLMVGQAFGLDSEEITIVIEDVVEDANDI